MEEKFIEWIDKLEVLSKVVVVEPQAVYCAIVGGFKYKVTYTIRIVPNIHRHLEKIGSVDTEFIPNVINGNFCNEMERKLLSLPVKYGRISIIIFCDITENEYNTPRAVIVSLIKIQIQFII